MKLTRSSLSTINSPALTVPEDGLFDLPEKVLQFGTGVLLRGLPDYFIDKANKQGMFNGRIVIVKSTSTGGTDAFDEQHGLFTQCIRGIESGEKVEENTINASISRVLSASNQWLEILACAEDPHMEIIISNTTEVGISLLETDNIHATPPISFPGKLLAFLLHRYQFFSGDVSKGMIVIPTELLVDNGKKLKEIVVKLATINKLDKAFIEWLSTANHFCSSLVDRIVPGKLPAAEQARVDELFGFKDELMIMSESYSLWAIEADEAVKEKLTFAPADKGVVIAPDINKFRELKLRLLNGTHTFSCGLAFLAGFKTVKNAMDDTAMSTFVKTLILHEMSPAIVSKEISLEDATTFAQSVLDRFGNPHIEHNWISITMQYSNKMKMRNVPVLLQHYKHSKNVPQLMALGFAAYILFMKNEEIDGKHVGLANGTNYIVSDDTAAWFAKTWKEKEGIELVNTVLGDKKFWEADLLHLPGFADAVYAKLQALQSGNALQVINQTLAANSAA